MPNIMGNLGNLVLATTLSKALTSPELPAYSAYLASQQGLLPVTTLWSTPNFLHNNENFNNFSFTQSYTYSYKYRFEYESYYVERKRINDLRAKLYNPDLNPKLKVNLYQSLGQTITRLFKATVTQTLDYPFTEEYLIQFKSIAKESHSLLEPIFGSYLPRNNNRLHAENSINVMLPRVLAKATTCVKVAANLDVAAEKPTIKFEHRLPEEGAYNYLHSCVIFDDLGEGYKLDIYFIKVKANSWFMHILVDNQYITEDAPYVLEFDDFGRLENYTFKLDFVYKKDNSYIFRNGLVKSITLDLSKCSYFKKPAYCELKQDGKPASKLLDIKVGTLDITAYYENDFEIFLGNTSEIFLDLGEKEADLLTLNLSDFEQIINKELTMCHAGSLQEPKDFLQIPLYINPVATSIIFMHLLLNKQVRQPLLPFKANLNNLEPVNKNSFTTSFKGFQVYNSSGEKFLLNLYFVKTAFEHIWYMHAGFGLPSSSPKNSFKLIFDYNGRFIAHNPQNPSSSDPIEIFLPTTDETNLQKITINLKAILSSTQEHKLFMKHNGLALAELIDIVLFENEIKAIYRDKRILSLGMVVAQNYSNVLGQAAINPENVTDKVPTPVSFSQNSPQTSRKVSFELTQEQQAKEEKNRPKILKKHS